MKFHPEAMKARVAELRRMKAAIQASTVAMRDERDALLAQVHAIEFRMRPMTEEIKRIESPLFEIDMEMSFLLKALGSRR